MRRYLISALENIQLEIETDPDAGQPMVLNNLKQNIKRALELAKDGDMCDALEVFSHDDT